MFPQSGKTSKNEKNECSASEKEPCIIDVMIGIVHGPAFVWDCWYSGVHLRENYDGYVCIYSTQDYRRNPISSNSQLERAWDAIMSIRGLSGGV